jgi:two-component system chemotaxis response regulator CheY
MSKFEKPLDRNMPILVVDDLAAMRRITRHCLTQLGFKNIHEAEDCSQALELLRSTNIGLVISDWQLPDTTTRALVDMFRTAGARAELPILMVAPVTQREVAHTAKADDRTELLIKPFTAEILEQRIQQTLAE